MSLDDIEAYERKYALRGSISHGRPKNRHYVIDPGKRRCVLVDDLWNVIKAGMTLSIQYKVEMVL
jgi:hypothetical protein